MEDVIEEMTEKTVEKYRDLVSEYNKINMMFDMMKEEIETTIGTYIGRIVGDIPFFPYISKEKPYFKIKYYGRLDDGKQAEIVNAMRRLGFITRRIKDDSEFEFIYVDEAIE